MGKKVPAPPPPPDPVATAEAQGKINRETAMAQAELNRLDEYTPYGSSVYTPLPPPSTGFRRDMTLDPAQQRQLDLTNAINEEQLRVAQEQVGRIGEAVGEPFSYAGMPAGGRAWQSSPVSRTEQRLREMATQPYDLQAGKPAAPTAQFIREAAEAGDVAAGLATRSFDAPFDYSSAPAAPGADAAARQQVIDSVYGQFKSRLDPRFEGEQLAMETKLANSGIPRGSPAFSAAMDDFNRARNDAYQTAQNAAIQAGGLEQTRMFGLGTEARQNAIAEANYLRQLPADEQRRVLALQGVSQGMRGTQFDAQANERDRQIQEEQMQRQLPMGELGALAAMQSGLFGLRDQHRARAIAEAANLRNVPLNETIALMSGTQIQNPAFGRAPQTGIAGTDFGGLVANQYASQVAGHNAQVQAANERTTGLIGMAATLGAGAMGAPWMGPLVGGMFSGASAPTPTTPRTTLI
jgi:hypothetical protein